MFTPVPSHFNLIFVLLIISDKITIQLRCGWIFFRDD